jgi:hypothetical protein
MALYQLDTENADRNITSSIAVLTHTPTVNAVCIGLVKLGDGVKNLSATGGDFEIVIAVGGQTVEPSPQILTFSTAVRTAIWTNPFPVIANDEVIIKVKSPNGADSDVDCTAYLFDTTYGIPAAIAGAAGGVAIAGSNAATTYATLTSTGAFTTGSIVNNGVLTQTGTATISALTVTNALTAGTNAVPWNAAYDAEVQSEVNDELILQNLDHLCKTATAGVDMTTEVVDGTIISRIISSSDTSTFVPATHSMAVVGADVAAIHVHTDKIPLSDGVLTWNATAAAQIQTEANDALIANNLDHLALTATAAADMTTEVADNTILSRIIANGDTSTFVQASDGLRPIATDVAAVHVHAGTVEADTNELQVDWVNGGRLDLILDIIAADTTTDIPALIAALDAVVDTVKAETVLIVADTGELQTDWANGGRLDLLLDKATEGQDAHTDTTEILTRLPDATAGTAGGLPTVAAGGLKVAQTVDLTAGQTIAASSVPAVTLANGAHGGAATTITLQTPIAATVPDTQKVDVNTIKTQAVTCTAGVAVLASVGTAATSTAQTGDSYAIVNGDHGLVSIQDDIDEILTDTGTTIPGTITTMQGNVTTIMADTDLLDDAIGGLVDIHTDVGTAITQATEANAHAHAIDLQTAKLAFTVANQVDSNVQYVNDAALTGNGTALTPWGPV